MKKFFKKETIIGLTVVVTLLILFFGIDYLKGINVFHPANYYYVTYDNVDGLAQSAPVTVNGFKVGLVREINYEYDNPGHIRVELSLDKQLKVPRGTKAILTTDMLGTSTIMLEMEPGASYHDVGDRLVGVRKPGLMDGLSGDLMPTVTDMIPKIDSLLVAITDIAKDPALASSIHNLNSMLANLEQTTVTLNRAMAPVPGIVNNASVTMTDVKALAANLNRMSADLAEVAAAVKVMPLDSTMNNIHAMSANLLALSEQLNNPNSSLGLLMNDPSLYNNINNSAAHIDSILVDLKRQPKRYIPSIKVF
ncbi:MAG: MCE family protein [Bacteroidales bacterium]|nr:MCE family protein [Bacteroidales bacterium]